MTETTTEGTSAAERRSRFRTEVRYGLEILALCAFVFAQPVLDVFGRSPETFLQHGASRVDIIGFALFWALVPAVALIAIATVIGLAGPTARWWTQVVVVAALAGTMAAIGVREFIEGQLLAMLATAALVAVATGALYRSVPATGRFLRFASPAPVVFVALFLFFSPVSTLVSPTSTTIVGSELGPGAPDLVVVVLDELPTLTLLDAEGMIDGDLYPNFDRFADDATWYRNATTISQFTNVAVPALATGMLPVGDVAPVAVEHPENLFTWVGDSYELHVEEAITRLCPADVCPEDHEQGSFTELLDQGAEVWADIAQPEAPTPEPPAFEDIAGTDHAEVFSGFTDRMLASSRPHLDYLHTLLPHYPWRLLPDGREYHLPPFTGNDGDDWASSHAAQVHRQQHVLQTMATDRLLGELLDRLAALGRYDDALVVVTADHGIAFDVDQPYRELTPENYEQLLWVPLLIKAPGQTDGEIDDRNVELIDVLPTIADHLDTDLPWETDGQSLLGELTRDPDTTLAFGEHHELEVDDDGYARVDAAEGFRRMLAQAPVVPPGDELRVWRQGRHGDLVGTTPEDHELGPPSDLRAAIDDPERFEDVDPDDEPPIAMRAALLVEESVEVDVAIAVNGTIGGWSESFEDPVAGEANLLFTNVPFDLLEPGDQHHRLYEITEPGGRIVLRPIELTDDP